MPLFLARGGVSLRLAPHEVYRRLHGHDCEGLHAVDIQCPNLAREISGDVSELLEANHLDCAVGNPHAHYAMSLSEDKRRLASEHVHEHLRSALEVIRGLAGEVAQRAPPGEVVEFLERLIDADLPVKLLTQLPHLDFEARKDVMNVFSALLRPELPHHIDARVVSYLKSHPTFLSVLLRGYSTEDLALHSGVVLRSCARHPELVEGFLKSQLLLDLINLAQSNNFEISSDAFCTLRQMLVEQKALSTRWLEGNMREFFQRYNTLLRSDNYCAERQAQKLLSDLFLGRERHFHTVMLAYVSNAQHLAINMNLLKDSSKSIQVEAFHLFKIFVGNPQKPPKVQQILFRNKAKILALLASLPALKPKDARFGDDVKATIRKVSELDSPAPSESTKAKLGWNAEPGRTSIFQGLRHSPQPRRVAADSADDIESVDSDDEV